MKLRISIKPTLILSLLAVLWITAGCSTTPSLETKQPANEDKIQVVATIYPLADIARVIGGDRVEINTLLPAGSSPHTFEATPKQLKQLEQAMVFIKVGSGLDDFTDSLAQATPADAVTVTLTSDLPPDLLIINSENHEEANEKVEPEHNHSDHHQDELHQVETHNTESNHADHNHSGPNPHIWLDPVLVREHITPQITAALGQVSPQDAEYFRSNQKKFERQLEQLHQDWQQVTSSLPSRTFIAFHSSWDYLAARYGFKAITVEEFPGREPTARWMAEVIDLSRTTGARAVFIEPQFNPSAAQTLAQEINVPVYQIDPLGGNDIPGYDSYLGMMKANLEVFAQALR